MKKKIKIMEVESEFPCNMCCFIGHSFNTFRNHTVRNHKNDPNFSVTCCIGACSFTTGKWNTFRSHLSRKHPSIELSPSTDIGSSLSQNNDFPDTNIQSSFSSSEELKYQNALYTLSMQVSHNMADSAIDNVISSTKLLLENNTKYVKQKIAQKLASQNISSDFLEDIVIDDMLHDLDTAAKRHKFYSSHDRLGYVKPEQIILGTYFTKRAGVITEKEKCGYYVPFQKSVCNMLNLSEVWHFIQNPHFSDDEFMHDISDGEYVRSNSLFQQNPTALQIVLNTDDLEIVNPLGTHTKKHKLTLFYYHLANIPPQYRSKLSSIQLLAIAKTSDVREKNGLNLLLKDFISVVNRMSAEGIYMKVEGVFQKVCGALVLVPADTLASNWLGQFKEGVGFAFKNCRMCEIAAVDVKNKLVDHNLQLRTDESHKARCTAILSLSAGARKYWSKMWGINGSSCLLDLSNFSITTCLVQDPMHILLEGIVPGDLSCLLYYLVHTKKLITLQWLNSKLKAFPYSYLHASCKPETTFSKSSLDESTTVKQSSSSMLTLCQILPLILGPKVPENDQHWMNFLRLTQVLLLCTSSYCHRETPTILRVILGIYLSTSKELYPKSSFIPKKHFATHFPRQMLLFGPLRHHWCMRFEGKHGFFKNKKLKNFKNIPYSLSKHHQLYMCLQQSGSLSERSNNFLYDGDVVADGEEFDFASKYPEMREELNYLCSINAEEQCILYRTNSVTIHGLQYQVGCCIVTDYIDDTPEFGILRDIVIVKKEKNFVLEQTQSPAFFNQHILHYTLYQTGILKIRPFNALKFKWPLSLYRKSLQLYIEADHSIACIEPLEMPVFKVTNKDRSLKKSLIAENLTNLKCYASKKLEITTDPHTCTVVLESDGTEIEDDEVLNEFKKDMLMLLEPGELWSVSLELPMPTIEQPNSDLLLEKTENKENLGINSLTVPKKAADLQLPQFSSLVTTHLIEGNVELIWNKLVTETANFYFDKLIDSHQYQVIGERIYSKFPCIKMETGAQPWSFFTKCVSQKIRHIRHDLKRKSQSKNTSGAPAFKKKTFETSRSAAITVYDNVSEDSAKHIEELQAEWKKGKGMHHIKVLLNETRSYRKQLLQKSKRLLKETVDLVPCFKDGTYILYEFRQEFGKERLDQTVLNIETLVKCCHSIMGKSCDNIFCEEDENSPSQFHAVLNALRYIEAETKFDRSKKGNCHFQSAIEVFEDVEVHEINKMLETKENTPPRLIVFRSDEKVEAAYIVGDCSKIKCFGKCLMVYVIQLFATYYVFDIEYPKSLAMFLGFLQQFIFGEQFTNESSKKFKFFCKRFRPVFEKKNSCES